MRLVSLAVCSVVNGCVIPRREPFQSDIGDINLQTLICGLQVEAGKCQLVAVWGKVRKLCSEQAGLGARVLIFINE